MLGAANARGDFRIKFDLFRKDYLTDPTIFSDWVGWHVKPPRN